jgi:hypothetical protein
MHKKLSCVVINGIRLVITVTNELGPPITDYRLAQPNSARIAEAVRKVGYILFFC